MVDRSGITASVKTETEAIKLTLVAFAELMFGTPARMWTGLGPLIATMPGESSQTWIGIGDIGSVSAIRTSADRRQNGIKMVLSGVNNDLLTALLTEDYQGRSAKIWVGFLDENFDLIPDALLGFSGQMAVMSTTDGDRKGTIELTCESRDVLMQRSSASFLTANEQRRLHPGDKGLDYVMALQSKEILWGAPSPIPAAPPFSKFPGRIEDFR